RRGRSAVRQGEHHPGRAHGGDRDARRPASPHAHVHLGRTRRAPERLGEPSARARPPGGRQHGAVRRRHRRARRSTAQTHRHRGAQPDEHAADVGGAVPAPLHRRTAGGSGGGIMTATVTTAAPRVRAGSLAGTRALVRLAARRDRIVLPVWAVVIGVLAASGGSAYEALYPNPAERAALSSSVGANPSFAIIFGPAYNLETAGGFTVWRFGTIAALLTSLVAAFTVTRHTRQEEDTGRQELLSSTVVGRYAPLTAGIATAGGFSVLTGVLLAAMTAGIGAEPAGSVAFGAAVALCGLVFTGVAAVTAQLAECSRTANTLAGA